MNPQLSPYQRKVLERLKKVKQLGNAGILDYLLEIEQRLDNELPSLTKIIEKTKGDKGDKGEKGDVGSRGEKGERGPQGIQGKTGIGIKGEKGDAGKNGKDAVVNTSQIATEASKLAVEEVKPLIPTLEAIQQNLASLGEVYRNALELLPNGEKLVIEAIQDLPEKLRELERLIKQKNNEVRYYAGNSSSSSSSSSGTWTDLAIVSGQTVYAVSAEPKVVVADGMTRFDGFGYTYSALTITFDIAPEDFIKYQV